MNRIKVAVAATLITVGVMLLLEHPEILTAGASMSWGHSYLGYDVFARSYAVDAVEILVVALGLISSESVDTNGRSPPESPLSP